MRITKTGEVYKASRITGPTHNFLGLVVSPASAKDVGITALPMAGDKSPSRIDEARLVAAVGVGMEEANQATGRVLHIHRIEYCPSDTPTYGAYTELARAIVLAAVADSSVADRDSLNS